MAFPLKSDHAPGRGLHSLSASDLNTIANMLNTLRMEMIPAQNHAEIVRPAQDGHGWKLKIPAGTSLPSNAGKSKYMVLQLSDNVGATADDPTKWTIDYVRATF